MERDGGVVGQSSGIVVVGVFLLCGGAKWSYGCGWVLDLGDCG